ncbi:MAG TPA: flagellar basal body P-ring formation chaperone FlgA [Burkholderiales bacterium]|nr:flagellar basal body P-ring formation chaperone FlgA [Burkholderiales bacterium]
MGRAIFLATLIIAAASITDATSHAAQPRQDPEHINRAVEIFLQRETKGLPGEVAIEIGKVDTRVALAACSRLQTFFPPGSRAWGQTSVGVRCAEPAAWTMYVPATVRVSADYLVAAKPLALGQDIEAADLVVRHGELTQLPAGVLTDASQAVGRKLANSVQAGQPLRRDAVRAPPAVLSGQLVSLVLNGNGFKVSSEGRTLGKAPEGESVQVRTNGGGIVTGIVRSGSVVEVVR